MLEIKFLKLQIKGCTDEEERRRLQETLAVMQRSAWAVRGDETLLNSPESHCLKGAVFLKYNPMNSFVPFSAKLLQHSGVWSEFGDQEGIYDKLVWIYCRDGFHKQMRFMEDIAENKKQFGWVTGLPGKGKSLTALAYAHYLSSNIESKWSVKWLHISSPYSNPLCFCLLDNKKYAWNLKVPVRDQVLMDVLLEFKPLKRPTFFILDGYTNSEAPAELVKTLRLWQKNDESNRRVLIVCSMGALRKSFDGEPEMPEYLLEPWTHTEYLSAVQNDNFYESVKDQLDARLLSLTGEDVVKKSRRTMIRENKVDLKFYFAGGSSRYMFAYKTKRLIDHLTKAMGDVHSFHKGMDQGARATVVVNQLFSASQTDGNRVVHLPVSQYVARELSYYMGPDTLKRFSTSFCPDQNPVMKGLFFENLFFATIGVSDLTLRSSEGVQEIHWHRAPVLSWNEALPSIQNPHKKVFWIRPHRFNQEGYDGVFVDKGERYVRFVQLTTSKHHGLRLEACESFLKHFKSVGNQLKRAEFYFVVPEENRKEFSVLKAGKERIKSRSARGLLSGYRVVGVRL
eukprot:746244-Hanusia_phi.AAC.1